MTTKPQNYLSYLGEDIVWEKGTDPRYPYIADLNGEKCVIRINDFPDEHLYTLIVNGDEIADFDDLPKRHFRLQHQHAASSSPVEKDDSLCPAAAFHCL